MPSTGVRLSSPIKKKCGCGLKTRHSFIFPLVHYQFLFTFSHLSFGSSMWIALPFILFFSALFPLLVLIFFLFLLNSSPFYNIFFHHIFISSGLLLPFFYVDIILYSSLWLPNLSFIVLNLFPFYLLSPALRLVVFIIII